MDDKPPRSAGKPGLGRRGNSICIVALSSDPPVTFDFNRPPSFPPGAARDRGDARAQLARPLWPGRRIDVDRATCARSHGSAGRTGARAANRRWRTEHGPFGSLSRLTSVSGVAPNCSMPSSSSCPFRGSGLKTLTGWHRKHFRPSISMSCIRLPQSQPRISSAKSVARSLNYPGTASGRPFCEQKNSGCAWLYLVKLWLYRGNRGQQDAGPQYRMPTRSIAL